MKRREFVRGVGAAGVAGGVGVAGCLDGADEAEDDEASGNGTEGEDPVNPPPVYDGRPDAVYYPTHTEGMEMIGTETVGDFTVGLSYSYPHRFWTVEGRDRIQKVEIRPGTDDIHLMASVWDAETGTFVPASVTATFYEDGEETGESNLWTMLSQEMGFHHGDNMDIGGDGEYEVEVTVSPDAFERRGEFEGSFEETVETTFDFEYSEARRDLIYYEVVTDGVGDRRAVEAMDHGDHGDHGDHDTAAEMETDEGMAEMHEEVHEHDHAHVPVFQADSPDEDGEVGDLRYDVSLHEIDGDAYLAVTAWTPHNEFLVPYLGLSAEEGGDETVLSEAVHPEIGHHYGGFVDAGEGDEVTVNVETPPQVARHEGYETAFMESGSFDVVL